VTEISDDEGDKVKHPGDNDTQLHADILAIGKVMLDTVRQMAKEQNRPLWEFFEPTYQALLVLHPLITEDDPSMRGLRSSIT
jgi:hypothetical protein